mmetsp:Transcript_55428/g.179750  ORF Transcript_55428/g.179750 Transcript_55428/m.179750 type:complete len:133 (+) Transcript_55428:1715-2113(+)
MWLARNDRKARAASADRAAAPAAACPACPDRAAASAGGPAAAAAAKAEALRAHPLLGATSAPIIGGAPDTSPGGSVGGYSRRGSAGPLAAAPQWPSSGFDDLSRLHPINGKVLKTASAEALLLDTETPLEIS